MAWGSLAPTSCQNNQLAAAAAQRWISSEKCNGPCSRANKFHLAPPPHCKSNSPPESHRINQSLNRRLYEIRFLLSARDSHFRRRLARWRYWHCAVSVRRDSVQLALSLARCCCVWFWYYCAGARAPAPHVIVEISRRRRSRSWERPRVLHGAARQRDSRMHTWMDGSPNLWLCGNSRLFCEGSEPCAALISFNTANINYTQLNVNRFFLF